MCSSHSSTHPKGSSKLESECTCQAGGGWLREMSRSTHSWARSPCIHEGVQASCQFGDILITPRSLSPFCVPSHSSEITTSPSSLSICLLWLSHGENPTVCGCVARSMFSSVHAGVACMPCASVPPHGQAASPCVDISMQKHPMCAQDSRSSGRC